MKNYTKTAGLLPVIFSLLALLSISLSSFSQSGCTDSYACNYDSGAVTDDGSCAYTGWYIPVEIFAGPAIQACEAPPGYVIPDQTCVEEIIAIDPFCAETDWDDLCQQDYEACLGCTPQLWIPVDPSLNLPVEYTCDQPAGYVAADPCIINVINGDSWCVNIAFDIYCLEDYSSCLGCTPQIYLPPNPTGGPAYHGCTPPVDYVLANQECAASVILGDSWCLVTDWDNICNDAYLTCLYGCETPGCTDPSACNYDELAGCDDGSCDYSEQYWWIPTDATLGLPMIQSCGPQPGYMIASQTCAEYILSIDPYCIDTEWDEICQSEYFDCVTGTGCTYSDAVNYNPFALSDDGSCVFDGGGFCPADITGDGIINTGDLTALLSEFGNSCVVITVEGGNSNN